MLMSKVTEKQKEIILDSLACKRAVVDRRIRAESNTGIKELLQKDVDEINQLIAFVRDGQLSLS